MPGTRTAPTVNLGTPNRVTVSVRLMDWSGDKRAVSLDVPATVTGAQIDAYVDALQALTNATIYEVSTNNKFTSVPIQANALQTSYQSVYDNVVLLMKDATQNKVQDAFLPAPILTLIDEGDVVDTSLVAYETWRDASVALVAENYIASSVRFTERREKNDSTPAGS